MSHKCDSPMMRRLAAVAVLLATSARVATIPIKQIRHNLRTKAEHPQRKPLSRLLVTVYPP